MIFEAHDGNSGRGTVQKEQTYSAILADVK